MVRKVEFPCALPLIMSGIRSATLQVIATVDGRRVPAVPRRPRPLHHRRRGDLNNLQVGYPAMVAAGIVVAVLAVVVDGLLNLVQRYVVSPGVSGRVSKAHPEDEPVQISENAVEAQLTNA